MSVEAFNQRTTGNGGYEKLDYCTIGNGNPNSHTETR